MDECVRWAVLSALPWFFGELVLSSFILYLAYSVSHILAGLLVPLLSYSNALSFAEPFREALEDCDGPVTE